YLYWPGEGVAAVGRLREQYLVAVVLALYCIVVVVVDDVQAAIWASEGLRELVLVTATLFGACAKGNRAEHWSIDADQVAWTEVLAVVGGVRLPDVGAACGCELRPGHVDAVLEGAADVVVNGHVGLVLERVPSSDQVVVLG